MREEGFKELTLLSYQQLFRRRKINGSRRRAETVLICLFVCMYPPTFVNTNTTITKFMEGVTFHYIIWPQIQPLLLAFKLKQDLDSQLSLFLSLSLSCFWLGQESGLIVISYDRHVWMDMVTRWLSIVISYYFFFLN